MNIGVPSMVCVVQHTTHNPFNRDSNKDSQPVWLESGQGLLDQSQVGGFLMDGPYKRESEFFVMIWVKKDHNKRYIYIG